MWLAGDIGGTKSLVALFDVDEHGEVREVRRARLESASAPSLDRLIAPFLGGDGPFVRQAVFGMPGPVVGDVCVTTNLPWEVRGEAVAAALRVRRVSLVNDFFAAALGVLALPPESFEVLQEGTREESGARLVLGAGTGLGMAWLVPCNDTVRVFSSEGGHVAFAPADELDDALLDTLRDKKQGRVSWERLVSGSGLAEIYALIAALDGVPPGAIAERLAADDPGALVGQLGLDGHDVHAVRALDRFVRLYGAVAGDASLTLIPKGGVYVAGGIAPKLLPVLRAGGFIDAFLDKGRMRGVVARLPVAVVMDTSVGLMGALREAMRLAS